MKRKKLPSYTQMQLSLCWKRVSNKSSFFFLYMLESILVSCMLSEEYHSKYSLSQY